MGKVRWKIVESHPNYEVSTMGEIRNIRTGRTISTYDDGRGYLRVKIDGRCERLHILVAVAFLPNPERKPIVNHKHGRKHDCRASQLEWATASENTLHAYRTGLIKRKKKAVIDWPGKRILKTGSKAGWRKKAYMPLEHLNRTLFSPCAGGISRSGAVDSRRPGFLI